MISGLNDPENALVKVIAECAEPAVRHEKTVKGSSEVVLELEPDRAWTISVEARGLWAAPRTEWITESRSEVVLALTPTGLIRGRLKLPSESVELSSSLQATFQSAVTRSGQEPRIGSHRAQCSIDPGNVFECELPAESLDLKLHARGFASVFLWSQVVGVASTLDLGEIALVQGASALGWVKVEKGQPTDVKVAVEPAGLHELALDGQDVRAELRTFEVSPDEKGFFQVTGLPAGAYRIVASHHELVTVKTEAFTIDAGLEATWPEPIELRRPVTLEVRLSPPTDSLGRPWTVTLSGPGGVGPVSSLVARAEADPATGAVRLEQVPPGRHTINVRDKGRGHWFSDQIDVRAGCMPLVIEMPVIEIIGWLRLGNEPLAGAVRFNSREGKGGDLWFRTDEEGVFGGSLPCPAAWQTTVRLAGGYELASRDLIDLSDAVPGETVEIEVRLDDTLIEGTVVDVDGKAVAEAHVLAIPELGKHSALGTADAYTDDEGSFRLVGLPPARVWLEASRGSASSNKIEIQVEKGVPTSDLRIVLRENHVITGQVSSDLGPVPGARVSLSPDPTERSWALVVSTTTRIDGHFELEVPAEHRAGDILVQALGYVAGIRRIPLPTGEPVRVHLGQVGGTLTVRWLQEGPSSRQLSVSPWLEVAGTSEPVMGSYMGWIQSNPGGSWSNDGAFAEAVIPRMPPGAYRACFPVGGRTNKSSGPDEPRQPACAEGLLLPHGELVLTIE